MDINKQCKRYILQSIMLVAVLNLLAAIASYLWGFELFMPLIVSTLFVLTIDLSAALIWRRVASKHADMLPSFFTGVSGFRFLGALAVFFVWYLAADRDSMLQFFVVFLVFYMVSLVHHSIFFSRVSNRL